MATADQFSDPLWRLNNLYYIKDKYGNKVVFRMNWAQKLVYQGMWYLCIILKARQLGMTTFIQIFMLDRCLFNSNINAGVIAHNREDAQKFFRDKIKFAYDNLPEALRSRIPATNDAAGELAFSNGSSIRVGTSLRSGTYQYLHISEFGKICAKYPDKAEEIKTGSLNTVATGQFVFIESTAEGDWGDFYALCMEYKNYPEDLTPLDYKFFFFSWYDNPEYVLDADVIIPADLESYFAQLEQIGIKLSREQKAWYTKKKITQKSKMKQEYPSTAEEAFEQISELAVYGKEIGQVMEEGRLCSLPIHTSKKVDLFFDIGKSVKSPTNSVWFMQHNDPWYDFVDFYQNSLRPVGDYVRDIKGKGYNIGKWYIPHDADSQKDYSMKTFKSRLTEAGVNEDDIIVVPRVDVLGTGIDMMKDKFPSCRFDEERTKEGWRALKAYRHAYDDKRATISEPVHDWASHPSDAIRQFAQGYKGSNSNDWFKEEINYPKASIA
jgi:hypothetical protein